MSWTAGEDQAMRDYRDEGARRLARTQPKAPQRGASLPRVTEQDDKEKST